MGCIQCGRCCMNMHGTADHEDIERWEDRPDIMNTVEVFDNSFADLWFSKITGEEATRCPWLRKVRGKDIYKCTIHDVKPNVCRNFPINKEHAIAYCNCKQYEG